MPYKIRKMKFYIHIITTFEYYRSHTIITEVGVNVKENNGCLFNVILILHKRRFNFIDVKYIMLNRVHIDIFSKGAVIWIFLIL